jgi:hypothetical protein
MFGWNIRIASQLKYWAVLKKRKRGMITGRPYMLYKFGPIIITRWIDENT